MRHCFSCLFLYDRTVLCIVEFTGHLLSDEVLLVVLEYEREGMGITNGNRKEIRINEAKPVRDRRWEWECTIGNGRNGTEKGIPAHL